MLAYAGEMLLFLEVILLKTGATTAEWQRPASTYVSELFRTLCKTILSQHRFRGAKKHDGLPETHLRLQSVHGQLQMEESFPKVR